MRSQPNQDISVPPRILLIDDDASVRRSISAFLSDSGFQLIEAASGSEGVSLFQNEKPDLVVCDLRMPDMDGLDVIKEVVSKSANTPVIVISGYGEIGDAVQALRLGAVDFLMKPVKDLEFLEYSVRRGLKQAALVAQNMDYSKQLESTNSQLRRSLDLLRMDQQAGRLVQTRLLPDTPFQVGCFSCQHKIVPSLYLSGDFVDYWREEGDQLVFYIADVSGHGASSAFVTVLLKYMARDITKRHYKKHGELSAAAILSKLNIELGQAKLQKHVTMFIGIIDLKSNTLSHSAAGHYPMPIVGMKVGMKEGSNDSYTLLEGKSFPLGVHSKASYDDVILKIDPGFSINLFSDGVLELIDMTSLDSKETYLIDLVTKGKGRYQEVYNSLGLDSVADAPDDVALLTIEMAE
ncbi:MAG: sigma-B regulation protein RsbU (phosphoserine phosphatase) [Pseudohongiellaceae bacterium]|jgi:sigma-B regulation protein RsbU (phosphoserine phosphatase)